ncbi:P-loop containing nucleoside triphosphate hydrolase protein [Entophlyctis helioformis]|nr:P-loop containing nucleoside triphosphate hydrolase protein [Entophlyctis helioformis]
MVSRHGFSSGPKKVLVIGSAASGKTSVVQRYVSNTFSADYEQTFGSELYAKTTTEGKKYSLQIWCCGGHERYRSLLEQFYTDASVVLVCFDMMNVASFQETGFWYNEVKRLVPDTVCVLVGTKADEADTARVKLQDAMKVSKDWGVEFRTVSAKTGNNVDDLFDYVISRLP